MDCINNGVNQIEELHLTCLKFTDDCFEYVKANLQTNRTLNLFDISKSDMNKRKPSNSITPLLSLSSCFVLIFG